MKKVILVIIALGAMSFVSCKKAQRTSLTQAIVTISTSDDQKCTMLLDEKTVLMPENIVTNPFKKEVRALTVYEDKGEIRPLTQDGKKYRNVNVYSLDSILTKKPVPDLGKAENDLAYGKDPIDVYNSWMTVVENGYITLHFLARWGSFLTTHKINLVSGTDPNNPYKFELRHDYNGDIDAEFGPFSAGIVAFDIKDILAKEQKEVYDITVSYIGEEMSHNIVFHYKKGEGSAHPSSNSDQPQFKSSLSSVSME